MAGQYELRKFLRQAGNAVLREYFERIGWNPGVDWGALTETGIEPLFEAVVGNVPEETHAQINRDFQQVNEMATEGGIKTLLDEGQYRGLDLAVELEGVAGLHDKVLRVLLDHPAQDGQLRLFDVARCFNRADNLPGRSWRKRSGIPVVERAKGRGDDAARRLEEGRKRLEEALSSYYRLKEGRGQRCTVEHFQRDDRLYWFAYVQDYEEARIEYNADGWLDRRTCKPVFEVIFAHSNAERSLDIFVKGDKKTVAELQTLWARAILGSEDLGTPAERGIEYELNVLKANREFPFDIRDGIEAVRVSGLRLSYVGDRTNRRITLEANTRKHSKVVFELLDELISTGKISWDIVNITQAVFNFVFAGNAQTSRQTIIARVTHPNSCSLKHEPKEEIARRYLREWKIDVSRRAQPDPPGA